MKYVFEKLEEQKIIPLSNATWDKLSDSMAFLPLSFDSSIEAKNEESFDKWYINFIKKWGIKGNLVKIGPRNWQIRAIQSGISIVITPNKEF